MATDTGFGEVRLFDDFLGTTYDQFMWDTNSTGGTGEISEVENGVFEFNNSGGNNTKINLYGAVIWQPDVQGTIVFEARVALVTSITQGLFIGLSDEATDEMPVDLDGGSLTTTADDVCGFVYDSQEDANWHIVSAKNTSAGTQTSTAIGPTLNTYQTFRIVVESNGDCRFFIDGDEITVSGAAREAAITTTDQYTPFIGQLDSGTAADVHIDYVMVKAGRA